MELRELAQQFAAFATQRKDREAERRAMLAEQLYRAQQLLAGHPYHRA